MKTKYIPQFVPYWGDEEHDAVLDVLNSDYLNEHRKTRKFENRFAKFVGAKFCITCTSGTIALYLALLSAKKEFKDIIVPDYMGIFVANATIQADLKPHIVDVDKRGCLNLELKNRFVVHANGRIAKTELLEDCCQALSYHTKGAISCYSFASTKHMTTMGQGGAVCCDNKHTYDILTRLKDHGRTDRQNLKPVKDSYKYWGTNFKFTEAQAAFGIAQLRKLPSRLKRLDEIYDIYFDELSNKDIKFVEDRPRWYVDILVKNPSSLSTYLKKYGIQSRRFSKPLHLQPLYKIDTNDLSGSVWLYNRGLMLPSTTNLSDNDIYYIASKIKDFLTKFN